MSRAALDHGLAPAEPAPWYLKNAPRVPDEPADPPGSDDNGSVENLIWDALCDVPEDGADVAELMQRTGLGRSTIYRYLAQLAEQGRAVQVGWGRWCTATPGEGDDDE